MGYIPGEYPKIMVDGAYGNMFKEYKSVISTKKTAFVMIGIGCTPFVSVMKDIHFTGCTVKQLSILVVTQKRNDLDWMKQILEKMAKKSTVEVHVYITADPGGQIENGIDGVHFNYKKPDIDKLTKEWEVEREYRIP